MRVAAEVEHVVMMGVPAHPHADRLDQRRSVAVPGPLSGPGKRGRNRFRIGPVEPGVWELSANGRTSEHGDTEPVRIRAPATDVHVVLPRVPVLQGQVLGNRLEDFEARVLRTSGDEETPWRRSRPLSKDGRFVFGDVTPTAKHVLFVRNPADDRFARVEGVTVADGELSIALTRGLALSGRVDLSGLDVPLMTPAGDMLSRWELPEVTAQGPPGVSARAAVDLDGSFAFRGLPPGAYRLAFEWTTVDGPSGRWRLTAAVDGVQAGRTDLVLPVMITR